MRDNVTSWIVSLCSPIALAISLVSKAFTDPLHGVIYGGILIILAGVTAVWGHVLDKPILYQWFGEMPGMAVETGAMFIVLGAEVIALAVTVMKIRHSVEDVDSPRTRKRSTRKPFTDSGA